MVSKNDNENTASTVIPEILVIALGLATAFGLAAYALFF